MDPGDYVYLNHTKRVVLRSAVDPRAARIWDAILHEFEKMGATQIELQEAAFKLNHDRVYHHEWAELLPMWCPCLAYYLDESSAL